MDMEIAVIFGLLWTSAHIKAIPSEETCCNASSDFGVRTYVLWSERWVSLNARTFCFGLFPRME